MTGKTRKKKNVKRAYSYIRFSRAHQIEGDSLRRQSTTTAEYCKRHNLTLDESLNLRDYGVSAFKGKNAKTGALGRFIDACVAGIVLPGSALILESLDRLSRQSPRKTVRLLTELLDDHGIEIHLTSVGKIFRPENEDGVDLIFAVALAMRANEESETKSKRLKEAFAEKRKKAAVGDDFIAKILPWWLKWDKAGKKIICPKDREIVLKRIFDDVAAGKSPLQVARELNAEKKPTWRFKGRLKDKEGKPYGPPIPATVWLDNRVRMTVLSDGPMGTIESTRKTTVAGRKWKLESYYPAIIDPDLVAKARATIRENRRKKSGRLPTKESVPNLLKGIARYRDLWCRFAINRNNIGWNGYYEAVDSNRRLPWMIAASQLEPILLTSIADLTPDEIKPPSAGNAETAILHAEVKELESTLANITMAVEGGSTTMIPRLVEVEKELATAREKLAAAETTDSVPIDFGALDQFSNYKLEHLKNLEHRTKIASSIRRLISRIQIGNSLDDLSSKPGADILTLEDGDTILEDTRPDPTGSRGKRPLAILILFHGGGQMAIQRGTEDSPPGEILITRIFRKGDAIIN